MREDDEWVGWGVATDVWDAMQGKAAARATLGVDGRLEIKSGTSDIGTGTGTALTIVAAETMGVPLEDVSVKLADSSFPQSPMEGGSWTVSSVGTAVKEACRAIQARLFKLDASPLVGVRFEEVTFADGEIKVTANPITPEAAVTLRLRSGTAHGGRWPSIRRGMVLFWTTSRRTFFWQYAVDAPKGTSVSRDRAEQGSRNPFGRVAPETYRVLTK